VGYRPLPTGTREELLQLAERRWDAVRASRRDLGPAVDLQRHLLALVLDAAATLEAGRMPRLSLPPRYLAAKLARGVPAFGGEPIPIPVPVLTPTMTKLCDALAAGGAGDAATHIREAIEGGGMDAGSLLAASLTRNQPAIRTGAAHRGLSPDLVWLVAELAVGPYVHALQQMLFGRAADPALVTALAGWGRGHCPACGSWPALAEVVAGHRMLRCSFCSSAWERTTYACIYCDQTGEPFVTAAPSQDRKDRRIEVCANCAGYLKTIDLDELSMFPLLSISDIETTDLDVAAMEHGYRRPALRDFGTKTTER
jgi:FdhE protein